MEIRNGYEDSVHFVNRILASELTDAARLSLVVSEVSRLYYSTKAIIDDFKKTLNPLESYIQVNVLYSEVQKLAIKQSAGE